MPLATTRSPAAAVAGTAVFVWLNSPSYVRSAMLVFVVPTMLFVWADFEAIAEDLLASVGRDSSLTGRPQLWDAAFQEVERRPFLGSVDPKRAGSRRCAHGLGSFFCFNSVLPVVLLLLMLLFFATPWPVVPD